MAKTNPAIHEQGMSRLRNKSGELIEGSFPVIRKDRNYPYYTRHYQMPSGVFLELATAGAVAKHPGRPLESARQVWRGVGGQNLQLFWEVTEVSGASIKYCPVCGESESGKFEYDTDNAGDRVLIGIYEHCRNCRLYDSDWFAGGREEEIGFVRIKSHYSDEKEVHIAYENKRKEALREAREMWRDEDVKPFLNKIYTEKQSFPHPESEKPTVIYEVDPTAVLVFADWLEEKEKYPLNLEAIRESQRGE